VTGGTDECGIKRHGGRKGDERNIVPLLNIKAEQNGARLFFLIFRVSYVAWRDLQQHAPGHHDRAVLYQPTRHSDSFSMLYRYRNITQDKSGAIDVNIYKFG